MMNSLKDLKEVSCGGKIRHYEGDHAICEGDSVIAWHDQDRLVFKMMTKPASEGGTGCQLTDLIEVALHQLKYLNNKFPCIENDKTIVSLEKALAWQNDRTLNRLDRGVEGKNEQ